MVKVFAPIHPAAGALPRRLSWSDSWIRGWRGPALAAMVVLAGALPGLVFMPPLDRDEARFAQASAQMLETGDFVNIRFQDAPRDKKPVGVHWLQAASVAVTSSVERREIWAYRIPSLAGAMMAAAACAWGAAAFLGARGGFLAGAMLGASFLLSSEAFIAKTDALLCGATALSMAALARLYRASHEGAPATGRTKALFWAGQAAAILVKGPIAPLTAGLALISLWVADRKASWMRHLGWVWGLVLVAAVVGPWAIAITVATDGRFWSEALGGDLAPKLAGGQEGHGAPPGLHAALTPLLFFPASVLLPAAAVYAWRRRREPFVRFALAWLAPSWLMFELMPTKLVHYPLPLYPALAWLAAGALIEGAGVWSRRVGAGMSVLAGVAFAGVCVWAASTYGQAASLPWAAAGAAAALAAGAAAAFGALSGRLAAGLGWGLALGVAAHAIVAGGLAPSLRSLWSSDRAAAALQAAHLDPRNGVTPGPVAVGGYAEPSLVFALGTATQLGNAATAAAALSEGRPALVEDGLAEAFRAELAARGSEATEVRRIEGFNYSQGSSVALTLWSAVPLAHPGAAAAVPIPLPAR